MTSQIGSTPRHGQWTVKCPFRELFSRSYSRVLLPVKLSKLSKLSVMLDRPTRRRPARGVEGEAR